jgi:hypothetical protein
VHFIIEIIKVKWKNLTFKMDSTACIIKMMPYPITYKNIQEINGITITKD